MTGSTCKVRRNTRLLEAVMSEAQECGTSKRDTCRRGPYFVKNFDEHCVSYAAGQQFDIGITIDPFVLIFGAKLRRAWVSKVAFVTIRKESIKKSVVQVLVC